MAAYARWVSENLVLSSFLQFAVLGSLGEVLGAMAAKRKSAANPAELLAKALVWGVLGILIKYSFTGFKGFLAALVEHRLLPAACVESRILKAFSLSAITNSLFGPILMAAHRTTDNLITRTTGYAGMEKSLATLAWFWLPAHTLTFMLPPEFQVGLAAAWSVALGVIMGFNKRVR